jgi:hypothetical protein
VLKRSLVVASALGLAALLAAGLYVRATYFFNPLTFEKNEVTYLPWTWYKRPLAVEFVLRDPKEVRQISDEARVRKTVDELRRGLRSGTLKDSCASKEAGRSFTLLLQSPGATLLHLKGCENDNVVVLQSNSGNVPITLTSELKALLQAWRSQAALP